MSIRVFRWMAVVLATIGLGLLWYMATRGQIPVVQIGQIERTMNFAYVRVAGRVVGDGRITRTSGRIQGVGFSVDDGSGELPVRAFGDKAKELVAAGLVPNAGDEVDVAGSLSVSAEDMAMWLSSVEQIKLTRVPATSLHLRDLTEDLVGRRVQVEGVVMRMDPPRIGSRSPWTVSISDLTAEAGLSFFADVYDDLPDPLAFTPGSVCRATAVVDLHRDKLQLMVSKASDLEVAIASPAAFVQKMGQGMEATPVETFRAERDGALARVRGVVTGYVPAPAQSRAQHRLVLGPGGGVEVVFRSTVAAALPPERLALGKTVDVLGRVEAGLGMPRLRVYDAAQFLGED